MAAPLPGRAAALFARTRKGRGEFGVQPWLGVTEWKRHLTLGEAVAGESPGDRQAGARRVGLGGQPGGPSALASPPRSHPPRGLSHVAGSPWPQRAQVKPTERTETNQGGPRWTLSGVGVGGGAPQTWASS